MKKSSGLLCGLAFFCGLVQAADKVEIIDFSAKPETFVQAVQELANKRYSMFPGDRKERTKFIYGYLYSLVKKNNLVDIGKVSAALNVKVGKFPNPKYVALQLKLDALSINMFGKSEIYEQLNDEQRNRCFSIIAHQVYHGSEFTLTPDIFLENVSFDEAILNKLLSIKQDNFTGTIFEEMARKALNKKDATVKEWFEKLRKDMQESGPVFKHFATGLHQIANK